MGDEQAGRPRHFDIPPSQEGADTVRILPYDTGQYATGRPAGRSGQGPSRNAASTAVPNIAPAANEAQERPTVVHVRKGPSGCAILAATFSVLAIACALLTFGAFRDGMDGLGRLTGLVPSFDFGLVTTPTVTIDTSRPTIIESVRAVSRLETVHYQMEKVISGESSGPLPDFLTGDRILLVAYGEVVAGVDLGKVRAEDIVVEGDRVTMRLPEPEILYTRLDNDKTYVYDRQTGIFSKPDPNLETQIRQAAEQQIRESALEGGILEKARENAEQVVRTLITGLGYEDVEFTEP